MNLDSLLANLPQEGAVQWIGVRPARGVDVIVVDEVEARVGRGLTGDRFNNATSKRQVTLIQAEHLVAIGSLLHREPVDPALLRRNIVVSGINLLALNGARFRIGGAEFEGTGGCHPCSKMEYALGPGGYNAMRGHGGITARVLKDGIVRVGDTVTLVEPGRLSALER